MMLRPVALVSLLLLAACGVTRIDREPDEMAAEEPMLAQSGIVHVSVPESFMTTSTPSDNVDSPTSWRAPDGSTWLLASAKGSGALMVYDGDTGESLRRVGGAGVALGQFLRPNGVAAVDDLLFVVERDNHRVQVLSLPDLKPLLAFAEQDLTQPYGLWVRRLASARYEVMVTDAYMAGQRPNGYLIPPPLATLDRRVQRYQVERSGAAISVRHLGAFGDTTVEGAIRIPESIWGDVAHDRLLIAEEDTATGTAVREYDLSGRYRGRTLGLGTFRAQAEGIALWQCDDGSGYWIATDQFKDRSLFHVFDRVTLAHLGAFAGKQVANTDGVWLHQAATTRFPQGVFYAVHDDQGVGAFDWRDIAKALDLRVDCSAN